MISETVRWLELLQGAGLAQLAQNASKREPLLTNPGATGFSAFDAPEDQAAIQIGMNLWHENRYDLTPGDIIWEIEHSDSLQTKP